MSPRCLARFTRPAFGVLHCQLDADHTTDPDRVWHRVEGHTHGQWWAFGWRS